MDFPFAERPYDEFMECFVTQGQRSPTSRSLDAALRFFNVLKGCKRKSDMSPILVRVVSYLRSIMLIVHTFQCQAFTAVAEIAYLIKKQNVRYVFCDVGDSTQLEDEVAHHTPDVVMYPVDLECANTRPASATSRNMFSRRAETCFAWTALLLESEWEKPAAFVFPPADRPDERVDLLSGGEAETKALARHVAHVTEVFSRQHRCHVFSIYLKQQAARLLYWDRAGAIVTERIDISTDQGARQLSEFIYFASLMDDAALGYDPSAKLATPAEIEMVRGQTPPASAYAQRYWRDVMDNIDQYAIYKAWFRLSCTLRLTDIWQQIICKDIEPSDPGVSSRRTRATSNANMSTYFVGKPRSSDPSMYDRGTKGFVAYSPQKGFVFLKQYWKDVSDCVHPELEIYSVLQQKNVRYIPTVLGGGPATVVDDGLYKMPRTLRTRAQDFFDATPYKPAARELHRLVLQQVARPLEDYDNAAHLISIISEAFTGE